MHGLPCFRKISAPWYFILVTYITMASRLVTIDIHNCSVLLLLLFTPHLIIPSPRVSVFSPPSCTPAFFSIMRFWGGGIFFWFNYALYSQLQVVHTFVQHCTTLFFYNKQLYIVQPNISIIHIFMGIEACVTIIWGCLTFYMY